jgi:hypothetical protein
MDSKRAKEQAAQSSDVFNLCGSLCARPQDIMSQAGIGVNELRKDHHIDVNGTPRSKNFRYNYEPSVMIAGTEAAIRNARFRLLIIQHS